MNSDLNPMLTAVRQRARVHGLADRVGAMSFDDQPCVAVHVPIPGERAATRRVLVWSEDGWRINIATLRQEHASDPMQVATDIDRVGLSESEALAVVDRFLGHGTA
jgi:hypothetical protein